MAQAYLSILVRRDEHGGESDASGSPLVEYAAQHWVDRVQFEEVTPRVQDGMNDLFDSSTTFSQHVSRCTTDENWSYFFHMSPHGDGSPLYYAAFCEYYGLGVRLIMKHSEQVNARGGRVLAPLQAALYKKHFYVANLLYKHGAVVDIQGSRKLTPLLIAPASGQVDVMRWLFDHGADANARDNWDMTLLFYAETHLDAVQVILEHNAGTNSMTASGRTLLYYVLNPDPSTPEGNVVGIVRRLLEHGADANIYIRGQSSSALHQAS